MTHAVEAVVAWQPSSAVRESMRRNILRNIPAPSHLPPYAAVFFDGHAVLWAQTSFPGDGETVLVGRPIRGSPVQYRMVVPGDLRVLEVGTDHVLGSGVDPHGNPIVQVHRYGPLTQP